MSERHPAPGDLYVLQETAELPVEWAVLDRQPGRGGWVLAVPADTNPLAGSCDVEIPPHARSGPLVLRCRFTTRIAESAFAPERLTGSLEPAFVERARRKCSEVGAGGEAGSPLEREADLDPEYADWQADVLEPAREAVARSAAPSAAVRSAGPSPAAWLLAAALLLAVVGLGVRNASLERQLEAPVLDFPSSEVQLDDVARGPQDIALKPEATHLELVIVLGPEWRSGEKVRLELRGPDGEAAWSSSPLDAGPAAELRLLLPRSRLREGEHRIGLLANGKVVAERVVRIDFLQQPG